MTYNEFPHIKKETKHLIFYLGALKRASEQPCNSTPRPHSVVSKVPFPVEETRAHCRNV